MDFKYHDPPTGAGASGDYIIFDPFTLATQGYNILIITWAWLLMRLLFDALWVSESRSWQLAVMWAKLRGEPAPKKKKRI